MASKWTQGGTDRLHFLNSSCLDENATASRDTWSDPLRKDREMPANAAMFLFLAAAVVAVFAFSSIVAWISTPARERQAETALRYSRRWPSTPVSTPDRYWTSSEKRTKSARKRGSGRTKEAGLSGADCNLRRRRPPCDVGGSGGPRCLVRRPRSLTDRMRPHGHGNARVSHIGPVR
jgi:hypothetical protein